MMIRSFWKSLAPALLLAAAAAAPALADGILIPEPLPLILPRPEPLAVKYHHVKVSVDHQTARTSIDQVFRNPNAHDLEAVYLFPMPEGASISDFSLWMNGRKVSGEILEAGRAREIYEDIVRRLRDPGLLEYAGRNLFRARVYPIPRHGEVKIEIVYEEVLRYDAGLVAYRYPLNTEKFSSADLEDVSITVDIRSDVPIRSLYSPSHVIDARVSGRTARCGWEDSNVRPDRDFLLYYTVSEDDVGLSLATHRLPGEEGYFMLLLSPGDLDVPAAPPKDVVFVVDASGSMAGEKIDQVRQALDYCLNSLGQEDRFDLITFATGVESFAGGGRLVAADAESVRRARSFAARISARGGTDIGGALERALDSPPGGRPLMLIFLTDGQPTVGETDAGRILAGFSRRNGGRARVFSFGVGYDVNTNLLDSLSLDNGGAAEYLNPGENIEVKVSSFFNRVSSPVLTDLSLDIRGGAVRDVYPARLPDLFAGSQLVVFGRYREEGPARARLTGTAGGRRREFQGEGRFERANAGNDFIPRLWATRKIAWLLTEIKLRGENRELVDEVIRLSREHGIVTPYTSYLIMEEGSEEDRRRIMPMTRSFAPAMESARAGMKSATGRDAFDVSKEMGRLREAKVQEAPPPGEMAYVGRKSFTRSPEGWRESGPAVRGRVTEIKYLSPEYFRLLRDHPEAGRYLSLGPKVTFTLEGTTYRIVE